MNLLAILMLLSLVIITITSLDPRFATPHEIFISLARLALGVVLGFVLIFLYGLGMPGLQYFFLIIGIGGLLHIFTTRRSPSPTHSQKSLSL